MSEKLKLFFRNLSFETMVAAQIMLFTFIVSFIVGLVISDSKTQDKLQQDFFDKCAAACYPNTVYSTEYKRCSCNAAVVVREIK
jgi:hypothetical protein